ncbi:MAG: Ni/Fe-hydrogenase cytochrome b subunit [Bryobacteraceae bacterium]|nr:Ni/Fe-hydrogenase cytochrome b subunit [Bryobacteraceae bacterium]
MRRVRRLKLILWLVTGLALAVAIARFLFGLGATTNLSDATPWGFWIGFDVMSGVALAAGGFVITGVCYIFKLERFHSIVRPAVLTAFLGYLAVAFGLLFDLGLPWNIWHMVIYWNPRSPLFEVGWCVMLYLTVLTLEFFPVPAEEFSALARVRRFLVRIRLPLVIVGIGLSTLHQSSLGSLFLIMPHHLHPLWYSPILPVLFFVSAVGLGMMMVMFESHSTAYLYRRKPETPLLARLGGLARWILLGYVVVRLVDLAARGQLRQLIAGGWQTWMFWFELAVMAIVPATLLFLPAVRNSRRAQWAVASMGVFGVVLNRVNVGGVVHFGRQSYLPAWTELAISAGVVSFAMLVFMWVVERFKVWEERPADPAAETRFLPEFDRLGMSWLGTPIAGARAVYSLAFVVAAALGFALINPQPAASRGVEPSPVHHALGGDVLFIDGNHDGFGVSMPHTSHQAHGDKDGCASCHHMNAPGDQNTGCHQCHQDMYMASDAFNHRWHASPHGAALECNDCHVSGKTRRAETAKVCGDCHTDLVPKGAPFEVKQYRAVGYVQAMHQLCIGCHAEMAQQMGVEDFARCSACHGQSTTPTTIEKLHQRRPQRASKRIVLPPY